MWVFFLGYFDLGYGFLVADNVCDLACFVFIDYQYANWGGNGKCDGGYGQSWGSERISRVGESLLFPLSRIKTIRSFSVRILDTVLFESECLASWGTFICLWMGLTSRGMSKFPDRSKITTFWAFWYCKSLGYLQSSSLSFICQECLELWEIQLVKFNISYKMDFSRSKLAYSPKTCKIFFAP